MNGLAWIAQIILAACFLITGAGKVLAYRRLMGVVETRSKGRPAGVSRGLAALIGIAEIAGALAVVMPPALMPAGLAAGHLLVRIGAAELAFIMVLAGVYHLRRNEEAAPAVTLFLLALFVILERWPR
ncbi:MAG TPA: DoxX family protein [Terracidiphilus sp.]|nr:DoxX family protein [Terracidiphilus sp.]